MAELELTIPNYDIKQLQVIQRNKFLRSKKDDLTVLECKFIRFVLSQISREEDIYKTYTISLNRLIDELDLDDGNAYREFTSMASDLMKKTIYVEDGTKDKKGNPNYKIFHWVDSFEYNNGEITVTVSHEIEKFLICSRDFTRYYLSEALALPTDNAIKLYELLWSWSAKACNSPDIRYKGQKLRDNEILYEIDFLRKYFNCESKYSITRDFIKRIIEYNVVQIKERLCIDVSYRAVKEGRKTTALIFQIGNSFQK